MHSAIQRNHNNLYIFEIRRTRAATFTKATTAPDIQGKKYWREEKGSIFCSRKIKNDISAEGAAIRPKFLPQIPWTTCTKFFFQTESIPPILVHIGSRNRSRIFGLNSNFAPNKHRSGTAWYSKNPPIR